MTEGEFISEIDCRFPYDDWDKCILLMEMGASISSNSAFMVLHEICRAPRSESGRCLVALLEAWKERFNHPLVRVVLPSAEALMLGKSLPVDDVLNAMREIANFRGQYNALAISHFAADEEGGDEVQALYDEIVLAWRR